MEPCAATQDTASLLPEPVAGLAQQHLRRERSHWLRLRLPAVFSLACHGFFLFLAMMMTVAELPDTPPPPFSIDTRFGAGEVEKDYAVEAVNLKPLRMPSGSEVDTSEPSAAVVGIQQQPDAPVARSQEQEPTANIRSEVAIKEMFDSLFIEVRGIRPVRGNNDSAGQLSSENMPHFSVALLAEYTKCARDSDLRALLRDAISLLKQDFVLPERFAAPPRHPLDEQEFKRQLEMIQKNSGLVHYRLSVILDEIQARSAERGTETKHWQAVYDYVCANLEARIAYLYEHNALLGQLRKEHYLLDQTIHKGWTLATSNGMTDRDAAKNAKNSVKYLEQIIKEHPGTPWALVATRERDLIATLGLKWVPLPK